MPFRVIITETGRRSMKEIPMIFNQEDKLFRTEKQAKQFIKEKYGNRKGKATYRDIRGKSIKTGRVYGFWNEDISHPYTDEGKRNRWFQEDWVEIRKENYSYGGL